MHVLQYVAVKLDNKVDKENLDEALSEATDEVESTLQGDDGRQYADWYDWFIVGGGRFLEGDDYTKNYKNCVAFADDPKKFNEILERQLGWRMEEAKRLHEEIKDVDFNDVVEDFLSTKGYTKHETKFDNRVWALGKLANLINDYWLSQSYFYDISSGTPSPTYITRDIEEGNGDNWVLVPVDFHH